jgi:hypothetical protein
MSEEPMSEEQDTHDGEPDMGFRIGKVGLAVVVVAVAIVGATFGAALPTGGDTEVVEVEVERRVEVPTGADLAQLQACQDALNVSATVGGEILAAVSEYFSSRAAAPASIATDIAAIDKLQPVMERSTAKFEAARPDADRCWDR